MLFAIKTNGVTTIVEAPNKAAANAYGAARVDMKVESPTVADMQGVDIASVPVVLKGGQTQAEIDAETQAKAARKAAAEAKKNQAPATV